MSNTNGNRTNTTMNVGQRFESVEEFSQNLELIVSMDGSDGPSDDRSVMLGATSPTRSAPFPGPIQDDFLDTLMQDSILSAFPEPFRFSSVPLPPPFSLPVGLPTESCDRGGSPTGVDRPPSSMVAQRIPTHSRYKTKVACHRCARNKLGCDQGRPCQRCANTGHAQTCCDREHVRRRQIDKRGPRPRGPGQGQATQTRT